MPDKEINLLLSDYPGEVFNNAAKLRKMLLSNLPGVMEQVDLPAKMIAYCYGQKYADMICSIIPSRKGIKLGFYKGNELADPAGLLEDTGKISRYVVIRSIKDISSPELKKIILAALVAYQKRLEEGKMISSKK